MDLVDIVVIVIGAVTVVLLILLLVLMRTLYVVVRRNPTEQGKKGETSTQRDPQVGLN